MIKREWLRRYEELPRRALAEVVAVFTHPYGADFSANLGNHERSSRARWPAGAQDEFTLAAIAQNLRRNGFDHFVMAITVTEGDRR